MGTHAGRTAQWASGVLAEPASVRRGAELWVVHSRGHTLPVPGEVRSPAPWPGLAPPEPVSPGPQECGAISPHLQPVCVASSAGGHRWARCPLTSTQEPAVGMCAGHHGHRHQPGMGPHLRVVTWSGPSPEPPHPLVSPWGVALGTGRDSRRHEPLIWERQGIQGCCPHRRAGLGTGVARSVAMGPSVPGLGPGLQLDGVGAGHVASGSCWAHLPLCACPAPPRPTPGRRCGGACRGA